jgi:type I restriction enzyme S subunit
MIALQEEMISELQAYKQSVITEAVTHGLNPNVKMKDSGIEWIGEIPENWTCKKLKFSCKVFGRIGFRGYTTDDMVDEGSGAITLSPSNMKNMKMDFTKVSYLSWNKYYESPEIMIHPHDVLMVKTGSTYGKVSFVDKLPMECTINPQIITLKKFSDCSKFIAFQIQSELGKYNVQSSVVGGTIPTIAQEKILNYIFPIPPLSEQQSIATYLDTKCSDIDHLISLKQEKIESLKAYKQSIIYEYVTGKLSVRC